MKVKTAKQKHPLGTGKMLVVNTGRAITMYVQTVHASTQTSQKCIIRDYNMMIHSWQ